MSDRLIDYKQLRARIVDLLDDLGRMYERLSERDKIELRGDVRCEDKRFKLDN